MPSVFPRSARWLLFSLTVAIASAMVAPGLALAQWQVGTPIVSYWQETFLWNLRLTDSRAQQAVEGGYNLVDIGWDLANELEVAKQYGLRVQIRSPLLTHGSLDGGPKQAQLDALINLVKSYPGVAYGYHLYDEPAPPQFPGLGQITQYLREKDPDRLSYINLISNTPIPEFLGAVQPQLISYDYYPFLMRSNGVPFDENSYLLNLRHFRGVAKQVGVPLLQVVQASSLTYEQARIPTASEMRYLAYTTLAYGGSGISWYNATSISGGIFNYYDAPAHTPTATYHALTPTNQEFVAIATQLQQLNSIEVYLKGYRTSPQVALGFLGPPGTMALPANSPFTITDVPDTLTHTHDAPVKGITVGLFGNGEALADATYALFVNNDYSTSRMITVLGPENLSIFDASTKVWSLTDSNQATLNLFPGGGMLVRLDSIGTSPPVQPGDFDGDGDVDGDDLTHSTLGWKSRFGVDLDGNDFLTWQREFGSGIAASLGASAAVPEPNAIPLAVLSVLGLAAVRRKRIGRNPFRL